MSSFAEVMGDPVLRKSLGLMIKEREQTQISQDIVGYMEQMNKLQLLATLEREFKFEKENSPID